MSKIKLEIICTEDSSEIRTKDGKHICTVYRDEDSHSAAVKVLEAIGFEIE